MTEFPLGCTDGEKIISKDEDFFQRSSFLLLLTRRERIHSKVLQHLNDFPIMSLPRRQMEHLHLSQVNSVVMGKSCSFLWNKPSCHFN